MGGGVGNGHLQDSLREKLTVAQAARIFVNIDRQLRT